MNSPFAIKDQILKSICGLVLVCVLANYSNAQNVIGKKIEVKYILPPLIPFRSDATRYKIVVDMVSLPFGMSEAGMRNEMNYYAKLYGEKYQLVESGADIEINIRIDRFFSEAPTFESKVSTIEKSDKTKVTMTYYSGRTRISWPMFLRVRYLGQDKVVFESYVGQSNQLTEVKAEGNKDEKSANSALEYEVRVKRDQIMRGLKNDLSKIMTTKFSYYPSTHDWQIKFVNTSKKGNYDDLVVARDATQAVLDSLSAKMGIIDDGLKVMMAKVILQWEEILKESDCENRKARIDKRVTKAITENLAHCHYFIRNFTDAQKYIDRGKELQKEPWQYDMEDQIAGLKQRFDANGVSYQ